MWWRVVENALEPVQLTEDVEEDCGSDDGDAGDPLGSVGRVFEREPLEVHAVDARDGECGKGDGAQDGEDLHDLIGAVRDGREINIEGVVEEVTLGFDRVQQPRDVIVGVADVGLVVDVDDGVLIALKMKCGVAGVDEDSAEIDEFALNGEDGLEDLGRGIVEYFVFELVDAVVEVVDRRKI